MTWYYSRRLILNVKKAVLCADAVGSIPPVSEQLTVVQVGNCVPGGSIPAKQVTSFRESMCLAPKGLSPS